MEPAADAQAAQEALPGQEVQEWENRANLMKSDELQKLMQKLLVRLSSVCIVDTYIIYSTCVILLFLARLLFG